MRGTRWLILVAITVILSAVAVTYRLQRKELQEHAPPKPEALAPTLNSAAQDWVWLQTAADGRPVCRVTAKGFRQVKDSNQIELEQVELRIYSTHADTYDLVHSAHAVFHQSDKRLYSDGDVVITLAIPNEGEPKHTLVSIHSSGVTFDSGTGQATTDRPTNFTFENGDGKAVGASYDPNAHELHMNSQAELNWNSPGPNAKPMKIEAGQLIYREDAAAIWLSPWARLTRGNTVVEAGDTVVTLQDRAIHHIDAQKAHGTDAYPGRHLQYAADHLAVDYGDDGEVKSITGQSNARLVSASAGSQVTATGDRVDLAFADSDGQSTLTQAVVTGNGLLESKPLPVPGHELAETRILRSQTIAMRMRPGGREIDNLETEAPGTLEFLPNRPGQRHRKFTGAHMWIAYGAQNRIQSFRSVDCRTESDPTPAERARKVPPTVTVSKNATAAFDPKTSQMTRMEQWGDFSYRQGDRQATADRGILEQAENRITLENHARMWDGTGATSADHIRLDEKTGNFIAEGHVNSSRVPDPNRKKTDTAMLSGDEPLQAVAASMTSSNHNRLVKYQGDVMLWQGADRIQADRVEINREKHTLLADGHVVTQSREEPRTGGGPGQPKKAASRKKPADESAIFTLVKAPHLVYTDQDRLAHYSGGVFLDRGGLQVKANDVRSWLAEQGADSRLQKAFADGAVQIVQTTPERTRIGTSAHAEYYTDDGKVILRGGNPQLQDSLRGNTNGAELIYYATNDRLLVNGSAAHPATSYIRRKHP
jgi:lipopolysaccharide export system protein LptA